MFYKVGDKTYSLGYQELKEDYNRFVSMNDDEFTAEILPATHLACIISWFKEQGQLAVADDGIVHELIHYMQFPKDCNLQEIRDHFKLMLKLD